MPSGSLARTQESLLWTNRINGSFVSLAYGPLDPTKSPLFMLSCFNGMNIAVLDVRTEIADAKPGTPLTIELTAGGLTSPIEAEATRDEADGVIFGEASDIEVKPILDVLRLPGLLTVKVGETSAILSDQGRAKAVGQFSEACQLD